MPVLKLRYLVIGIMVVAGAIAGPLLSVRKQVYLRDLAIRRETLGDSLAVCRREAMALSAEARSLSSPQRVEQIARERLNMDYPTSNQIVIVENRRRPSTRSARGFLALLKRSLGQGRS